MIESEFNDDEDELCEDLLGESVSEFTLLESEYKITIQKLQDNEDLTDIKDAHTKLYDTYCQSRLREQELMLKISEMQTQLEDNEDEIHEFKKTSVHDAHIINDLTQQLQKARLFSDKAHEREQEKQEVVESMRAQIMKLNTELELKSRLTSEEDDGALSATREGYEREKQRLIDEITSLKQKLRNLTSYSEELERKTSAADLKASELNSIIEQNATELTSKQRHIEKQDGTITTMKMEAEQQAAQIRELEGVIDMSKTKINELESELKEEKMLGDKMNKNLDFVQFKLEKCQSDYDELNADFFALKEKYSENKKELNLKHSQYTQMKNDLMKAKKQRDNCEKRLMLMDRAKANVEEERNKLHTTVSMLEREVTIGKKKADEDGKHIDNLIKGKELLHKNIVRINNVVENHLTLIKIQTQGKKKLESDIQNYRSAIGAHRKTISKMEMERNRALEESLDLTQQVEDAMDDIKLKQQSIHEHKKIIAETETKLRQQQNLFETVRADRNSFLKQLQVTTADVNEVKSKLKISLHQNEQLKEDISAKEALMIKQETVLRKVNKEMENLKVEVQNGLNSIQKLKHEIAELQQTEKSLSKFIQENETVIRAQAKDLSQLMNDKDVIGSQLVRRNDEIGLLYEKIKILETTLHGGEAQYDQRIEDIRLLKLEVKRLRQENNYLSKSISNMTDLKHEVFTLERELAEERLKCTALEEELQNPMNIHRWRKLEGSKPEVLNLLEKIQILQKRVLSQTSESIEQGKQLKETEKLYNNLKQMLAKQPSPEIKDELVKTQKALVLRGSKMKCLVSELNMYEAQATEYKIDLEKLTNELNEVKKKYFNEKKLNEHLLEQYKSVLKLPPIEREDSVKFTGGGFKMTL